MRYFRIDKIITLRESTLNPESSLLKDTEIEMIPIIKTYFDVFNQSFRCIEHKTGSVTLKNDFYTLKLIEIYK